MTLKKYWEITKPGIIFGNSIPVVSGFLLASRGRDHWGLFAATVAAGALGLASACVFNNVVDREADARMERTKHRAIVKGHVSVRAALLFAAALGLAGSAIMVRYVNVVALAAGAVAFFFYIVMYSMWWKPRSPWGTLMGAVAGAMPPVVGYAAVTGRIDAAAVIMFSLMLVWQMPHFFAIAVRRKEEYAAAKLPVMPVVHGVRATKAHMLAYIVAFTALAPLLTTFGYLDATYAVVALGLGVGWLALCLRGLAIPESDVARNVAWARGMFEFSLIVMMGLFITIGLVSVA